MIISGGFNVYPQAIEQAIYEHPSVEECAVIGVKDPYRGEAAKAFIKLKAGAAAFLLEELQAFLADKIGPHEMPVSIEFRETLPRTAVGKIQKTGLRKEEQRKEREGAKAQAELRPRPQPERGFKQLFARPRIF
jgi:long-chain acyl-CoA synthetase